MNDLDVLREFAPDAPLLPLPELSVPRERVLAGITQGRKRHGPAMRIAIGGVTVAAAAAITAGALAGTPQPSRHPAPRATRSAVTVPVTLTAREVLEGAAQAALKQKAAVPRADQFVYTKVDGGTGESVVQTWLSVNGTRDGLERQTGGDGKATSSVIAGCANGSHRVRTPGIGGKPLKLGGTPMTPGQYQQKYGTSVPMDGPVLTVPCTPAPAYFPDMPASAAAMGAYLQRTQGIRPGNLNDLAKTVGFMLESDYILPAQRAALYEFLATTPGLIVEHDIRDIGGRPGVGVGWSFEGGKAINIFAPGTYAYLGLTTWGVQGQEGGDALIQTAIVDHPGQLP